MQKSPFRNVYKNTRSVSAGSSAEINVVFILVYFHDFVAINRFPVIKYLLFSQVLLKCIKMLWLCLKNRGDEQL